MTKRDCCENALLSVRVRQEIVESSVYLLGLLFLSKFSFYKLPYKLG
jgi:hypothetical protein